MEQRHENLHLDEVDDITWQENLYFCGFDDQMHNGFAVHLKLIPAERQAQLRGLIMVGEQPYTFGIRRDLLDRIAYPEYHASNPEPFRRWELTLDAIGHPVGQTGGYMGLELAAPGRQALAVTATVELSTTLLPIDWSVLTTQSGAGSGHYDHAHTWTGTLNIGDHTVNASGLGVRDHSWGARRLGSIGRAMFVATVAPDLSEHRTGVVGTRDGNDFGFGFLSTPGQVTTFPKPTIDVVGGSFDDETIPKVRIVNAGEEVVAITRTEILMPLLRDQYLSRDLIGITEPSNGFSFVECGTGLNDAAATKIRRDAYALS